MRAAARARLLLLAALLLCCGAAVCDAAKGAHRASRKRSVRSRVSVGGSFSPTQRAQLREKHDAGWANISLARICGKPPVGYDPPQWRREPPPSRRVALRGWLVCNAAAGVHESLFAVPGPAFPMRDEAFTAAFKGRQRTLSISPADGVGRLVRAARPCCARHAARGCSLRFLRFPFAPAVVGGGARRLDPAQVLLIRRRAAAGPGRRPAAAAAAAGGPASSNKRRFRALIDARIRNRKVRKVTSARHSVRALRSA